MSATSAKTARTARATLRFARGGGRTFLAAQAVPYPFHITRPHYLDTARPELATLYVQSASGGLYEGDRLSLSVEAGPGAFAHVTSQAATVVHTASGIEVDTRLHVADGAFLAMTTDPYILFPATTLTVTTEITLAPGARALVAEGFSSHDPANRDAPFARLATACRVRGPGGRMLLDERSRATGRDFAGEPLGGYRALGTVLVLGDAVLMPNPAGIEAALDPIGILAGASPLPNGAGLGVRLLARDGGHLGRGLEVVFAMGFTTLLGSEPARRRK